MVTIVSSWNAAGASLYGDRFIRQFADSWSFEVRCILYLEGLSAVSPKMPSNMLARPFETTGWPEFGTQLKTRRFAGFKTDDGEVYQYRWDAVKFSKKVFALAHAADTIDDDLVIWLDGDTVVRPGKFVDADWLRGICQGAHINYLGRERPHSETSFMSFDRAASKTFPAEMRAVYSTMIFADSSLGWTDSDVFDATRHGSFFQFRNLTLGKPTGAVFERSRLGERLEHLKGARKETFK